jgi:hypothetical protein
MPGYTAGTQPKAMKTWVAKQPDASMREALTWILDHVKGAP